MATQTPVTDEIFPQHTGKTYALVELVATILQMQRAVLHPTINLDEPDPELDLDFVPGEARQHRVGIAMSNAFGFGGLNSCIVVGQAP